MIWRHAEETVVWDLNIIWKCFIFAFYLFYYKYRCFKEELSFYFFQFNSKDHHISNQNIYCTKVSEQKKSRNWPKTAKLTFCNIFSVTRGGGGNAVLFGLYLLNISMCITQELFVKRVLDVACVIYVLPWQPNRTMKWENDWIYKTYPNHIPRGAGRKGPRRR